MRYVQLPRCVLSFSCASCATVRAPQTAMADADGGAEPSCIPSGQHTPHIAVRAEQSAFPSLRTI